MNNTIRDMKKDNKFNKEYIKGLRLQIESIFSFLTEFVD